VIINKKASILCLKLGFFRVFIFIRYDFLFNNSKIGLNKKYYFKMKTNTKKNLFKKTDWYQNIEKPVRKLVKLLRNNGFNTTCSCGHEMFIELELGNNMDEVEKLASFLWENNYSGFKIDCKLEVPKDGFWLRRATIYLNCL